MIVTPRPATRADLPAVVAMLADDHLGRRRESLGEPLDEGYAAAFAAIEADANQLLMVFETADGVVGCLQLTFIPCLSHRGAWRGQIEGVRVATAQRGRGIGRQMIQWAVVACRRRGCGIAQLSSDESRKDARRFYESMGFTASHVGMKLPL